MISKPVSCPECGGEMDFQWSRRTAARILLLNCRKCNYVCLNDFVAGFWAGYKKAKEEIKNASKIP